MKALPVNLRTDLKGLSDAELAARLEEEWRRYESAEQSLPWLFRLGQRRNYAILSRGPIRHPLAYRFLSGLGITGSWLDLVFAAALTEKRANSWLRKISPGTDMDLSLCEIQDIVDEIENRVADRQAKSP